MANHPKLIKIPGPFMDAVKRLLQTTPPPKTAKDRKATDDGLRSLEQVRPRARARKRTAGTPARKPTRKAR